MFKRINTLHIISSTTFAGAEKTTSYTIAEIEKSFKNIHNKLFVICRSKDQKSLAKFFSFLQNNKIDFTVYEAPSKVSFKLVKIFSHIIQNENINILHGHGYKGVLYSVYLKYRFNIPALATMHGWTGNTKKVIFYEFIEKLCYFLLDAVFLMTKVQKKEVSLLGHIPKNIYVVPSGIPSNEFISISNIKNGYSVQSKTGLICFGFMGRLSVEKGIDLFLSTIKTVLYESCENIKIFIAGEGPLRPEVELFEKQFPKHVKYMGFLKNVEEFYSKVDIIVIPSLREGMPRVLLEGMARGKLIVSSDAGGMPELVIPGKTGFIYPKDEINKLKDILNLIILKGVKCYAEFCLNGRQSVQEQFSIKNRAEKIGDTYMSIIRRKEK